MAFRAGLRSFAQMQLCQLCWGGSQRKLLQYCTNVTVSSSLGMATCELGLQERKHLAFTLKDTKTIMGKLERIAVFVIHVLMPSSTWSSSM